MNARRGTVAALMALAAGLVAASPAGAATFTVTNVDDTGAGSLRQAITDANATVALDEVHFNIAGAGIKTIIPFSALPEITQPLRVLGTTQPGYAGSPLIELDGTTAGLNADGLRVGAAAN